MEPFAQVFARRAARSPSSGMSWPTVSQSLTVELDADVPRDGGDVRRTVGGAADRGVDDDGVFERLAGQDAGRA